jgi:DNA repair exonuclease SbcCD ATPase subunit
MKAPRTKQPRRRPPRLPPRARRRNSCKLLQPGDRASFTQKAAVANLESRKEARDGDQDKIFDDQQRLRENMKSLKGSAEEKALLQPYTQQLNAQETRLEELHKAMDQLDEEISKAQAALDATIESLVFDVKL